MGNSTINKTYSLALSSCHRDRWKIDSRKASSVVGTSSKFRPIAFSATPSPCYISSFPLCFLFHDLLFSHYPLNLMTFLLISLQSPNHSHSISIPYLSALSVFFPPSPLSAPAFVSHFPFSVSPFSQPSRQEMLVADAPVPCHSQDIHPHSRLQRSSYQSTLGHGFHATRKGRSDHSPHLSKGIADLPGQTGQALDSAITFPGMDLRFIFKRLSFLALLLLTPWPVWALSTSLTLDLILAPPTSMFSYLPSLWFKLLPFPPIFLSHYFFSYSPYLSFIYSYSQDFPFLGDIPVPLPIA